MTPPIKIECRYCLGDGYVTHGHSQVRKLPCPSCKGAKREWIDADALKDSDVVIARGR